MSQSDDNDDSSINKAVTVSKSDNGCYFTPQATNVRDSRDIYAKTRKWRVYAEGVCVPVAAKSLAFDMFYRLHDKLFVGEKTLTKTLLMCACVCCAERQLGLPNNEQKIANQFGGVKPRRLRRAILAVKRELPQVRDQYKRDADRILEICENVGIETHIAQSVVQFAQNVPDASIFNSQHTFNSTKCYVSPGTKCAVFIYYWLKRFKPELLGCGKLNFIRACRVSPNGFRNVLQALRNVCDGL